MPLLHLPAAQSKEEEGNFRARRERPLQSYTSQRLRNTVRRLLNSFTEPMDQHSKESDDVGEHGDQNSDTNGNNGKSTSESLQENNGLEEDDFPDFDPDGLEVEDDWQDVFGDEDDDGSPLDVSNSASATEDDNDAKTIGDDSANGSMSSATLMPPPPSIKEGGPKGTTSASTALSSTMPISFSNIPGIESLVTNRPPLDHSITRRKKTAGADRRDSAPPSWHSEAADRPHRQAMVQDV